MEVLHRSDVVVTGGGEVQVQRLTAVDLQKTVTSLRSWNVEGVIVINTLRTETEQLRGGHDVPMLFSDIYTDVPGALAVHADDFTGGRLPAEHFIENGHRQAVFLGPIREVTSVDDERWRGFCSAFEQAGLPAPRAPRFMVETTVSAGIDAAAKVLALEPRPTAVFCSADDLAAGFLRGVAAAGVCVPADISVIGFDGFDISQVTSPVLTTIGQDIAAKAELSVDLLVEALDEGVEAAATRHPGPLAVRLLPGGSVGRV